MVSGSERIRCSKRWRWAGLTMLGLLTIGWWWVAGPRTLFRIQIWLLTHGGWSNLQHWIDHGNWYLPFLIAETDNLTPVPVQQITLSSSSPSAFESVLYLEVDTVGDCVRVVLRRIAGDDGVGTSFLDGTTNEKRLQAARYWEEWYARNRHKLRWDSQKKVFEIVP